MGVKYDPDSIDFDGLNSHQMITQSLYSQTAQFSVDEGMFYFKFYYDPQKPIPDFEWDKFACEAIIKIRGSGDQQIMEALTNVAHNMIHMLQEIENTYLPHVVVEFERYPDTTPKLVDSIHSSGPEFLTQDDRRPLRYTADIETELASTY